MNPLYDPAPWGSTDILEDLKTRRLQDENKRLREQLNGATEAIKELFEHCAMVHKHWGDNCNQKEANNAIAKAKSALAKAECK